MKNLVLAMIAILLFPLIAAFLLPFLGAGSFLLAVFPSIIDWLLGVGIIGGILAWRIHVNRKPKTKHTDSQGYM